MPSLAWWPGTVKAGSFSDESLAFWDMMPTFCELAGTAAPESTDGISFVPLLTGKEMQNKHDVLFWYFNERAGPMVAVRFGKWKAIRRWDKNKNNFASLSLYDLSLDPAEKTDLAGRYPEVSEKAFAYMKKEWVEDPNFPQVMLLREK